MTERILSEVGVTANALAYVTRIGRTVDSLKQSDDFYLEFEGGAREFVSYDVALAYLDHALACGLLDKWHVWGPYEICILVPPSKRPALARGDGDLGADGGDPGAGLVVEGDPEGRHAVALRRYLAGEEEIVELGKSALTPAGIAARRRIEWLDRYADPDPSVRRQRALAYADACIAEGVLPMPRGESGQGF